LHKPENALIFILETPHMFKFFQFIRAEQEFIHVEVPKHLRGKLVEIIVQEKAPDPDTRLDADDEEQMAQKQAELKLMDDMRNQLQVWDI